MLSPHKGHSHVTQKRSGEKLTFDIKACPPPNRGFILKSGSIKVRPAIPVHLGSADLAYVCGCLGNCVSTNSTLSSKGRHYG